MKRGIWHQLGDKSQKLALEQLEQGIGVGVVMSPRDVSMKNAVEYAKLYKGLGAEILVDQQFYLPDFTNKNLETYNLNEFRAPISQLAKISDSVLRNMTNGIASISRALGSSAVIAPAIVYESGRRDIAELNARLFCCAQEAATQLGVPCYATLILGKSTTTSDHTMLATLSEATSLPADGWYFGYEFPQTERIPTVSQDILRFGVATITLACTNLPVFHAYAGPMGILSPVFAATAAGISHFQNTWQFSPSRWQSSGKGGGGGDAPSRFFSTSLWGTIIYPDEIVGLPRGIREQVVTPSPFSEQVKSTQTPEWSRWEANKHLIYSIATSVQPVFDLASPRKAATKVSGILNRALDIHESISRTGIQLHDGTNTYQANWKTTIENILEQSKADYDYLDALVT